MSSSKSWRFVQGLQFVFLAFFWVLAAYSVVIILANTARNFSWQVGWDVGFLNYFSWLVNEKDYMPYRDLFDTSFPGTFLIHMAITQLVGYSDIAFHWVDTATLCVLLIMTWFLLGQFHARVAAAGVVLFALYYSSIISPSMHFQRDYLGIFPVVCSLLVLLFSGRFVLARFFITGMLFGIAFSIKPHLAISWPLLFIVSFFWDEHCSGVSIIRYFFIAIMVSLFGFLFPLCLIALWLYVHGALEAFIVMVVDYLPLYMKMSGDQLEVSGRENFRSLLVMVFQGNWPILAVTTCSGAWALYCADGRRQKLLIILLLALLPAYLLYVVLGGKNWDYHRIPYMYFFIVLFALFLMPCSKKYSATVFSGVTIISLVFFFLGVVIFASVVFSSGHLLSPGVLYDKWRNILSEASRYPVPDPATQALYDYLKVRTRPGEKVEIRAQGTYGPIFPVALRLQLLPVSRYPLQLLLYRHVDDPRVVRARRELLKSFSSLPRFFLDDFSAEYVPSLQGERGFPEYEAFMLANYQLAYSNKSAVDMPEKFVVYERSGREPTGE